MQPPTTTDSHLFALRLILSCIVIILTQKVLYLDLNLLQLVEKATAKEGKTKGFAAKIDYLFNYRILFTEMNSPCEFEYSFLPEFSTPSICH